jgi:hypothetical protein
MAAPPPAPFEALRQYLLDAVEQLLHEMADQQVRYLIPAGDALRLLERVADLKARSPWHVWEAWALRHALPVHDLVEASQEDPLTPEQRAIMKSRLRDLLGYALLGLVLVEKAEKLDNIDKF